MQAIVIYRSLPFMYNSIRLRCIHQTKPQRMAKESEVSYSMNTKKHTAQITIPVTALIIGLLLLLSCFMPEEAGAYSQKDLQYALENYQLSPPAYSYNINAENPKLTTGTPRFKKQGNFYINPDAEESGSAVIMITGDLMCQYRQQESVFQDKGEISQYANVRDFKNSFQYIKPILARGDLVIGNLETMLSHSSPLSIQLHKSEGKPYLNAPVGFLEALDYAGYDLFTMANNHCCDTGVRGIFETIDHVNHFGFLHTGLFTSKKENRYLLVDVNGIKIGIVSYAVYFNEKDDNLTKEGQAVLLNRYRAVTAEKDIQAAKSAGAQFVLAFLHCGTENSNQANPKQKRISLSLADAGADYIIGSHSHALQPYEILTSKDGRRVPVIYSMGNFLSHMKRDINNDTIVLQLKLKEKNGKVLISSQRYYPCKVYANLGESHYVILPSKTKHRYPFLSEKETAAMKASRQRIAAIYGQRTLLPFPYAFSNREKYALILQEPGMFDTATRP